MAKGWHGDAAGHARAAKKRGGGRKSGLTVTQRAQRLSTQLRPLTSSMSTATWMGLKKTKQGRKHLRRIGAKEYAFSKLTNFRTMSMGIAPRRRKRKKKN